MTYTVQIHCTIPAHIDMTNEMLQHLERQNLKPGGFRTKVFDSQDAFYHYVRGFDYTDKDDNMRNHFLEAIMCNPNDSRRHIMPFNSRSYWRQTVAYSECFYVGYLTYDSTDRVVDLRNYLNELYAFNDASYEKQERLARREQWETRNAAHEAHWEKARRLYEGKAYWKYYRRVKTTQERRYAADKEHKPYVRGKRSFASLPNSYDDLYFRREKTWKARNKKTRKQWGANICCGAHKPHR